MMPASPVARRLPMLGLASACAVALTLSACGGSTTTEKSTTAPAKQHARVTAGASSCQGRVGGFLKTMTVLRSNLAVGLSYEQYAAEMREVRAAYDKIPVAKLTIDCLTMTGTPAEKALNKYTDAANAWGECLAETGCDTASIEHGLQRQWRVASHYLSEAQ